MLLSFINRKSAASKTTNFSNLTHVPLQIALITMHIRLRAMIPIMNDKVAVNVDMQKQLTYGDDDENYIYLNRYRPTDRDYDPSIVFDPCDFYICL